MPTIVPLTKQLVMTWGHPDLIMKCGLTQSQIVDLQTLSVQDFCLKYSL